MSNTYVLQMIIRSKHSNHLRKTDVKFVLTSSRNTVPKMRCPKLILLLFLLFSLYSFVLSHELPKQEHDHYSFKVLQEAVNGDSLMPDDVERLLSKLRFWNCSDNNVTVDYRKVKYTFALCHKWSK